VRAVLGSRSTDTLAWVGPPRVRAGTVLPLGPAGHPVAVDVTRPEAGGGPLRLHPGPRADWCRDALEVLCGAAYEVTAASNRVGLRLSGRPLRRARPGELPSEGLVLGAVQVPPDGQPVVFLADHPSTGGYPVVAVVDPRDLPVCAQVRPGETVAFARA
jgi:allophanate hydrolase subunit 2